MIHFEKFSAQYTVRRIAETDLEQVLHLCKGNPQFYHHCPPFATEESLLADMKALPDGKSTEDKYYLGFWNSGKLAAVMDFIDNYPHESTAFIGFFMVDKQTQHQGIGTQIIQELCQYLHMLGYRYMRLGWVKGNRQSESFWHKNHFSETGISYRTNDYTVIVAQRDL